MTTVAAAVAARRAQPDNLVPEVTSRNRGPWFMFRDTAAFEWTTIGLPIPGLPAALAGFRVVHLSDLHCRNAWSRGYDRLIEELKASPPDLLLYTGDFVDDKLDHRGALPILHRLLPQLSSRLGTYAILGNHDVDIIRLYLPETGVHLIDGHHAQIAVGEATIELIGLPGLARTDLDCSALQGVPPKAANAFRVVLSHYPDHIKRTRPLGADLFLAGHTHGGQICLPGGRPIFTHDSLPSRFSKGVHRLHDMWLVVSRGFGFAGVPVRICCPAQVAEITLRPYPH